MRFFDAGKEIRKILLSDDTLKGVIDNRIYPLVADKGTKFPFIVYRKVHKQPVIKMQCYLILIAQ